MFLITTRSPPSACRLCSSAPCPPGRNSSSPSSVRKGRPTGSTAIVSVAGSWVENPTIETAAQLAFEDGPQVRQRPREALAVLGRDREVEPARSRPCGRDVRRALAQVLLERGPRPVGDSRGRAAAPSASLRSRARAPRGSCGSRTSSRHAPGASRCRPRHRMPRQPARDGTRSGAARRAACGRPSGTASSGSPRALAKASNIRLAAPDAGTNRVMRPSPRGLLRQPDELVLPLGGDQLDAVAHGARAVQPGEAGRVGKQLELRLHVPDVHPPRLDRLPILRRQAHPRGPRTPDPGPLGGWGRTHSSSSIRTRYCPYSLLRMLAATARTASAPM